MARNKSQQELSTEKELRERVRIYATAVEWLAERLQESQAQLFPYQQGPAAVQPSPANFRFLTYAQATMFGGTPYDYAIPAPLIVLDALEAAVSDLAH